MTFAHDLTVAQSLPVNLRRHVGPFTIEGCWPWEGYRDPEGYGRTKVRGRSLYAHRVIWETINGPIPEGLQLGHLCADRAKALTGCAGRTCPHRACVNPDHLALMTAPENQARGRAAGIIHARRDQLVLVGR
jgi:hypothetical protein